MTIENQFRAIVGCIILISLLLFYFHSHYWLWLTTFVGVNLLQSSFTQICPLDWMLRKLNKG